MSNPITNLFIKSKNNQAFSNIPPLSGYPNIIFTHRHYFEIYNNQMNLIGQNKSQHIQSLKVMSIQRFYNQHHLKYMVHCL